MLVYLLNVVLWYLFIGLGFALASWLQACEIAVNKGQEWKHLWKGLSHFVLLWHLWAVYCYQTEVTRTRSKIDFSKFK